MFQSRNYKYLSEYKRKMRVSLFTIVFLTLVLMVSILVANVTNLITIKEPENHFEFSNKKYDIIDDSVDHLMWFLQISDLHISIFKDPSRITEFKEFCDITVGVLKPSVVLASGDLTDAKTKDAMGSKQTIEEWKHYKNVLLESRVLEKTNWLDVRGNHDNFNVVNIKSSENYFTNYSVQGKKNPKSYMHQISIGSDKFSFIAIDACLEPGPRRPFNFVGFLDNKEIDKIHHLANESLQKESDYIIWFGHYPTSCILTENREDVRDIIGKYKNGMVYLCGHYHTLGGISPEMYTLHHKGFLELELADWKDNRMFRLGAIDHGHFSFIDLKHRTWPVVLITNPKHILYTMPLKESSQSIIESTHIRILAFSTAPIKTVLAQIDNQNWLDCYHVDGPLYAAKWNPVLYKNGLHHIRVKVLDENDRETEISQPFALDKTRLSFKILSRILLMSDATTIFGIAFGIMLILTTVPLCIFRIYHTIFRVKNIKKLGIRIRVINCFIRKLWIVSTIDRIFYPLVLYPLYLTIGPWAVGEIIDNQIGIIFAWGMFIGDSYLPGCFTYAYGFYQLLTFHAPLTILLAHRIDKRFLKIGQQNRQKTTIFSKFLRHLPILILLSMQFSMIYFFWLAYGTLATFLCPLRTWSLLLAVFLWYQANYMPKELFRPAAIIWSASSHLSTSLSD